MAANLARNTLVVADLESTYGTPATLDPMSDTMLVFGNPQDAIQVTQANQRIQALTGTLTPQRSLPGPTRMTSTLVVAMQSTGAPAAEPYFARLLKGCGMEMIVENPGLLEVTHVERYFKFRDTGFESLTIHVYAESIKHILAGAFGNCTIAGTAGNAVLGTMNFQGQYSSVATGAQPAFTLPANRADILQKAGVSIGSYTAAYCRSFSIAFGWTIVDRPEFSLATSNRGLAGSFITNRAPTMELVVEAEQNLAGKDFFAAMVSGAISDSVSWIQKNTAADDWIRYLINNPQIVSVPWRVENDFRLYGLGFEMQNATARNEFSLVVSSPIA